jgi:hypothetical protein
MAFVVAVVVLYLTVTDPKLTLFSCKSLDAAVKQISTDVEQPF